MSSLAVPLRCRRGRRLSSVYVHSASMCSLRWCIKKKSAARPRSQVLAKSCPCPTSQARATSRRAFAGMSARYTSHPQSALQKITLFRPETCSGSPIGGVCASISSDSAYRFLSPFVWLSPRAHLGVSNTSWRRRSVARECVCKIPRANADGVVTEQ